jgi:bifunctional non-homologous end joining protein LigD
MLASAGEPPDGFALEWKWDGARTAIQITDGSCRIFGRSRHEITEIFPELAEAVLELAPNRKMVLDGEVVVADRSGVPRFQRLQRRLHVNKPPRSLLASFPAQLIVFDLLTLEATDLTHTPYLARREQLMAMELSSPAVSTPPHYLDVPAERMLQVAADAGLEGLVGKAPDSIYTGGRSRRWIKRTIRRAADLAVVGTLRSRNSSHDWRSLVMAGYSNGLLTYAGCVGSGLSAAERRTLQPLIDRLTVTECPLDIPPPLPVAAAAIWLRPYLVGEVEYREFTGTALRHPVWRGLRDRSVEDAQLPTASV